MKEKIRQDEEEYLKKRKINEEMNRLTEQLSRDKKVWETTDFNVNDMMDNWVDKLSGENNYLNDRKSRLDILEKETKTKYMSQIAQARQQVVQSAVHSKEKQAQHSKKIQEKLQKKSINRDLNHLEKGQWNDLQNEWQKRKQDMLETRNKLNLSQKERAEE
jgi:hypothetical protein